MISSDESWTQPPTKLKRPSEWVVGMVRAAGILQADPARFTAGQALLGEPLWRTTSPKGYSDDQASWLDGQERRLGVANNFAGRVPTRTDTQEVIERALGSSGSPGLL